MGLLFSRRNSDSQRWMAKVACYFPFVNSFNETLLTFCSIVLKESARGNKGFLCAVVRRVRKRKEAITENWRKRGRRQGDQICRIFAHCMIIEKGRFFSKSQKQIFGLLFFKGQSYVFNLTNNGLGYILGDFFTNTSGHRSCSPTQLRSPATRYFADFQVFKMSNVNLQKSK
jgi:hypothetical protein